MSLATALNQKRDKQPIYHRTCRVEWILHRLRQDGDREGAEALLDALRDPAWAHEPLAKIVHDSTGIPVSASSLGRHRRGVCLCERE